MPKSHITGQSSGLPTPTQLKELFTQIKTGHITRGNLQKFLDDCTFPDYELTVDYGLTVEQLIKAGKYNWTNSDITSRNFPSCEKDKVQADIVLLNFDRRINSEDVIQVMNEQNLRPATLKELLALGVDYPNIQQENPIVALGSTWRDSGGSLLVPYLRGDGSRRNLDLRWFEGGWAPSWRFAARK